MGETKRLLAELIAAIIVASFGKLFGLPREFLILLIAGMILGTEVLARFLLRTLSPGFYLQGCWHGLLRRADLDDALYEIRMFIAQTEGRLQGVMVYEVRNPARHQLLYGGVDDVQHDGISWWLFVLRRRWNVELVHRFHSDHSGSQTPTEAVHYSPATYDLRCQLAGLLGFKRWMDVSVAVDEAVLKGRLHFQ